MASVTSMERGTTEGVSPSTVKRTIGRVNTTSTNARQVSVIMNIDLFKN